ncbi:MAG: alpha-L-rhamnosidase C-terminal domain-containing protein, partial [Bacteroidota bacterium]
GYYHAVAGTIRCDWKIDGTRFILHVTVPANTNAMIYVPSVPDKQVLETGKPASQSAGLRFKEYQDNYAVFEAESGNYNFESICLK